MMTEKDEVNDIILHFKGDKWPLRSDHYSSSAVIKALSSVKNLVLKDGMLRLKSVKRRKVKKGRG